MTTATLNINLAVTPKTTSIADGVNFVITAGANAPSGVIGLDGGIDLTKQYAAGTSVALAFALTTSTIKFTTGTSVGTFNMSFFGAGNGTKDAFLLVVKGQGNPGIYGGSQFSFPSGFGPGYLTLSVTDNNNDGLTYEYAVVVFVATQGTLGVTFKDDPRIVNHTQNRIVTHPQ